MGKPKQPEQQPIIPSESVTGGSSSWSSGAPISFAGFQDFSKTGGFSAADLANIRARAISPVRAVYANAQQNVNRQRALQGGYSPGFNVLQSRMAREQGQGISDASTNAEASIAEMVQQGKLAGLQGMAGTEGRTGGSSGGGGSNLPTALVPEKKKGFWGSLWGGLKKVGQIALPVAAGAVTGGLAAPITAGLTGAGTKLGMKIAGAIPGAVAGGGR